jgi:hypothetical protein
LGLPFRGSEDDRERAFMAERSTIRITKGERAVRGDLGGLRALDAGHAERDSAERDRGQTEAEAREIEESHRTGTEQQGCREGKSKMANRGRERNDRGPSLL